MKISYNWLKQYINTDLTPKEIGDILTAIGLEVENIDFFETVKGGLQGLIVGEVREVVKHPNADKLNITKVDVGANELLQIVCGASNVAAGQKVVVAPLGSTIYPFSGTPIQLKKAKIRDVESHGMICAEDEIGLGESHEGIMVLPDDAATGMPLKELIQTEQDYIIEIGLTPNRSDAMSHVGVARDLAAALAVRGKSASLQLPDVEDFKIDNQNLTIPVSVEDYQACPRYSGITISNVAVKASPDWLLNGLKAIGIRPINNIVDATNFVLHELGQPLHAFDADKIEGQKVIVKKLPKDTFFTSLDNKEIKLSEEDLVICNEKEGMCIAGVYGGFHSGVKEYTKNVFLESAYFDPAAIRRTSQRHGLRTDAASRYEKGADPHITLYALKRAALLIKEIAGGEISSEITDIYPNPIGVTKVSLSLENLRKLTGISIPKEVVEQILINLEIDVVDKGDDTLVVSVPAFKTDVTREVDVIEEVLRIYGYDNVPMPHHIKSSLSHSVKPDKDKIIDDLSDYLSANGFYEIFTNSLTFSEYFNSLPEEQNDLVRLLSYANAKLDVLRPTMLMNALESVSYNINRKNNSLKFYEFGKIYSKVNENYIEKEQLSLIITGNKSEESWNNKPSKSDIFYLKGVAEAILKKTGITGFSIINSTNSYLENSFSIHKNDIEIVALGQVKKSILNIFDIKQPVCFASFNFAELLNQNNSDKVRYKPVSKYPSVTRDLALILNKSVSYSQVEKVALKSEKKLLKNVSLFDVYEDVKIGADKKSYAVSFTFLDEEKTLTDDRVEQIMNKLIINFQQELQAELRK